MMRSLLCFGVILGINFASATSEQNRFVVYEQIADAQTQVEVGTKQFSRFKLEFNELKKQSGDLGRCARNFTRIVMIEGSSEQSIVACHNMRSFPKQKPILQFADRLKKTK